MYCQESLFHHFFMASYIQSRHLCMQMLEVTFPSALSRASSSRGRDDDAQDTLTIIGSVNFTADLTPFINI